MNTYAICDVATDDLATIAVVEAEDSLDAQLLALRYGDDCIAVLEYTA